MLLMTTTTTMAAAAHTHDNDAMILILSMMMMMMMMTAPYFSHQDNLSRLPTNRMVTMGLFPIGNWMTIMMMMAALFEQ
jgi:hypothetical protein